MAMSIPFTSVLIWGKYAIDWCCLKIVRSHNYLSVYSVRTNGPTLCPKLWPPYVPESVEKPLGEARGFVYTNASPLTSRGISETP